MQISLSPEVSQLVQARMRQGDYTAPEDVVCDALHHFLDCHPESMTGAVDRQAILIEMTSRYEQARRDPSQLISAEAAWAEVDEAIDQAE